MLRATDTNVRSDGAFSGLASERLAAEVEVPSWRLPLRSRLCISSGQPDVRSGPFASHDTNALLRGALEAGARGFLLKSDAKRHRIAAAESVAAHHPFFVGGNFAETEH